MIHILLLILKIILWILLAILGIVLLLVLLVLFAPICYKADVDYHGTAKVKAKVKFLCVSVKVLFDQEGNKLDTIIRIFGIRFGKRKDKPKKTKRKRQKNIEDDFSFFEDDMSDSNTSISETLNEETLISGDELSDNTNENIADDVNNMESSMESFESLESNDKKSKRKEKKEKIPKDKGEKVPLSEKLDSIKLKVEKFKRFWNLKCTVKTKEYLKKYLIGVCKHVGPRRIKGYVRYGFDDPSTTGKVTGYLSLMPFVYHKKFSLYPDFHEKIIEADVKVKGHFCLGYIARIVLKVDLWRTIKAAKKLSS